MPIITYRPLHDGPWMKKPRPSRLGWERAKVGDTIFAHGSETHVKESLTRVHVQRLLDWVWDLKRREDLDHASGATCWECKRVR